MELGTKDHCAGEDQQQLNNSVSGLTSVHIKEQAPFLNLYMSRREQRSL
jgi:hypothetical protein